MTTYGSIYQQYLSEAKSALVRAEECSRNGNVWNAHIELSRAIDSATEARDLLHEVSKTAFERVFKEKA